MICTFKETHHYFADVFKHFRNKCIELFEFDSAHFFQQQD